MSRMLPAAALTILIGTVFASTPQANAADGRVRIFRPFGTLRFSRFTETTFGLPSRQSLASTVFTTEEVTTVESSAVEGTEAASTAVPAAASEVVPVTVASSSGRPVFRPRPRSPFRPSSR